MASEQEYEKYIEKYKKIVTSLLSDHGARPVLFIGSRLTRRYLNGPSWSELLAEIARKASVSDSKFAYLSQKAEGNPIELGTLLSDEAHT